MKYEYAELANMFWDKHNAVIFKASEIALYFFLMNSCNKGRWINPFQVSALQMRFLGLSEDTIISAKRTLKNNGLIDFDTKKGSKYTTFELINLPKKSAGLAKNEANLPNNLPANLPSDLPNDLPKIQAGLEITPIIHENIKQLQKKVCDYFGFSEGNNFQQWKAAYSMIECLAKNQKLDFFEERFMTYQAYKLMANEKKHGFVAFVGTAEKYYLDGGWNAENWGLKLSEIKPKANEKSSTQQPTTYVAPKEYVPRKNRAGVSTPTGD
ncbi:MAG: hypothetical protein V4714_17715 [Bacteroidota bacterium]